MEIDFTNLGELLAWLAGPAGMVAWALYFSNLFRNLRHPDAPLSPLAQRFSEFLSNASPEVVQAINLVGFVLPPVIAYLINAFLPAEWLAAIAPHFGFVAGLVIVYIVQQVWHKSNPVVDVFVEAEGIEVE